MQNLRSETNAKAAEALRGYISLLGMAESEYAAHAGVPWSSLRLFLGNASKAPNARRHKRGPYAQTLAPLLKMNLPNEVRDALLDAIEFDKRILLPLITGRSRNESGSADKEKVEFLSS
jgi:hypothetical protein